ncbi:WG repeat-containing protein [Flavivirga amylovorans]|uniref:WG repeat-containing protein n=1 Tax=Flavivirga amylovorans TaxID=870486 RepID=A0ABT8WWT2_9FLAO|nr:WG repeat-containing protein [Flavivirga amylovorans]MDO5986141.1 WG repeat-containing protein [Flavivirga amylovorans]
MKITRLVISIFSLMLVSSCREYIDKKTTNHQYFDKSVSDTISTEKLIAVTDEEHLQYGVRVAYVNEKNDTIIPFGKYAYYGTDTLEYYANVLEHPNDTTYRRLIAIDRNQNVLFDAVVFNNGPEPFVEGLTRVIRNGKMGFANKFGQVVIPCVYDFAKSFKNGKAEVTYNATEYLNMDKHKKVESDEWFMIDEKGNRLKNDCDIGYNLVKKNDSIIASLDIKTILEKKFWWNRWDSMNEPDLRKMTSETYRLTNIYLDGTITVIRMQKNKNAIELIIKKQLGTSKYRPDPKDILPFDYSEKKIKANEWNDFIELTNQMNFWTMPFKIDRAGPDNDGSSLLLLEGFIPKSNHYTKRNYHIVTCQTVMDSTTNFKKLYDKIYELSKK